MVDTTNWDNVYYDRVNNNFIVFKFNHEDTDDEAIGVVDAFTGTLISTISRDKLDDEETEFKEISGFTRSDPAGALDEFLRDSIKAINQGTSSGQLNNYDPIELEFAVEALRFKRDNDAEWVNHMGLN